MHSGGGGKDLGPSQYAKHSNLSTMKLMVYPTATARRMTATTKRFRAKLVQKREILLYFLAFM